MKISANFILKVAGTLTVIALITAALLGLVNQVTRDRIAEIDAENTRIAMSAVAPEGSTFGDKMEITEALLSAASAHGGKLVELYPMTSGGENGYVMKISASGSQGSIVMMVGVDAKKAVTGISVVSHAETSGIGTKVVGNELNAAGVPVLDQFVGLSGAGSLAVGKNISAVSGATVSTRGINMGANAALAVAEVLG
ncbi:MAG: FMN-binding protein [Ruminococcaceae bacterium]|nr:FMN-binding protein [Oscillospiraceae bacterium]